MTSPPAQPRNPLHGLTIEAILTALVATTAGRAEGLFTLFS